MRKQLLVGAMLLGSFLTANAQIVSVDFSNTEALADWLNVDGDGDTYLWTVDTEGFQQLVDNGFTGGVALSASYDNTVGPLTPDNSLISQAFDVPANGATLSFKIGGVDPEYSLEHYAVYVIESSSITETTTVGEIVTMLDGMEPIIEETLTGATAVTKTASLLANANQNVRVVFRHYDITDQFVIALDDVVVTEGVTGNTEFLSSALSVFPNPTNGVVNIVNNENVLINNVSVTDLNGRVVKTIAVDGVAEAQVNVSDLASGVYMMTISSDKGSVTKKIVKN